MVSFTLEHYFLCFKYVDMSFVSGCFLFVLCLWVFLKSLFCTYFFYPVAFICVITVTLCVHSLPCLSHQGWSDASFVHVVALLLLLDTDCLQCRWTQTVTERKKKIWKSTFMNKPMDGGTDNKDNFLLILLVINTN